MSEEPNRKSYVRQFGERTRVDSGLRVLPDIAGCTTYRILMWGRTLHPEQQPVVREARIVQAVLVAQQASHERAELE